MHRYIHKYLIAMLCLKYFQNSCCQKNKQNNKHSNLMNFIRNLNQNENKINLLKIYYVFMQYHVEHEKGIVVKQR